MGSGSFSLVVTDAHRAVFWNLLLGAAAGGQLIQIVVYLPEAFGHTLRRETSLGVLVPAFIDGGTHQSHTLPEMTFALLYFSKDIRPKTIPPPPKYSPKNTALFLTPRSLLFNIHVSPDSTQILSKSS